jgi:CDP-4-dehydro-6-deoxyglucose reductase
MRSGEPVEVQGPFGDFALADETPRPLLFLAWGNGFAPIRSLVEHVLAQESAEVLDLLWLSDSATGHYQDNLCRSWQDAMDNLHYRALVLPEGFDVPGADAQLTHALNDVTGIDERHVFVAGPRDFVATARDVLMTLGVDPHNCRIQAIPPQQDG